MEPTLSCVIKLLLSTPASMVEVLVCLGRLLSGIITTLGLELSLEDPAKSAIITASFIMQSSGHAVHSEAVFCLLQLHKFSPYQTDLTSHVPDLVPLLSSPHITLRMAGIDFIRQLAAREAKIELDVTRSANNPEQINRSRFHLLLGVNLEALCSPMAGDPEISHSPTSPLAWPAWPPCWNTSGPGNNCPPSLASWWSCVTSCTASSSPRTPPTSSPLSSTSSP